jgi:predicted transcriptional regulator
MEKQEKIEKTHGMGRVIARKTGIHEGYVSRVLAGKVNRAGKKARVIVEMAEEVKKRLVGFKVISRQS